MVGSSPLKRGPESKIPSLLLEAVATYLEMRQSCAGALGGLEITNLLAAAIKGTRYAKMFTIPTVWLKLCREFPHVTQADTRQHSEHTKSNWTTYEKIFQWFDDVKEPLIASGLAENQLVLDEHGNVLSELTFSKCAKRRIIIMDETHHDLGICGDKSGYRNVTYHNPGMQRSGSAATKSSRHITGVYASNAAGEALPPMYIFDTTVQSKENFQVRPEWGKTYQR